MTELPVFPKPTELRHRAASRTLRRLMFKAVLAGYRLSGRERRAKFAEAYSYRTALLVLYFSGDQHRVPGVEGGSSFSLTEIARVREWLAGSPVPIEYLLGTFTTEETDDVAHTC